MEENKLLEVKESSSICISCCDNKKATREISINRAESSQKGSNIVSFSLCNECLNKLAREFNKFS